MRKNDKFLLKLWVPVILLLIFAGVSLSIGGNINSTMIVIPIVAVVSILLFKSRTNNGVKKALQSDTPTKLIETIAAPIKRIPQQNIRESYTAYNTALSFVFYGKYDNALEIMNAVDWEAKEPMFQALNHNIRCLIYYFTDDINLGLTNARKAKALASTSAFPGAKKSMEAFEAYVEVGQILTGLRIGEPIKSLELKFEKQPLLPKLIIAWGLMNGYHQQKDLNETKKMIEFCELNAPHCTRLTKPIRAIQEEINFA